MKKLENNAGNSGHYVVASRRFACNDERSCQLSRPLSEYLVLTPDPGHRLHLSPSNKPRARVTMTHNKTGFLFDGVPEAEMRLSWGL